MNYVSWFDAARVANWLHNGRSTNPALLETGAYTLNNAVSGIGFTKNEGAKYWMPSKDEWYKADWDKVMGLLDTMRNKVGGLALEREARNEWDGRERKLG